MDARKIAKYAADHIVLAVSAAAFTKLIQETVPASEDHDTVTKLVAGTAGFAVSDHFSPQTHAFVDRMFNRIESHQAKKNQPQDS